MEEKNKELLFESIDKYKATHDDSEFNTIYSMIVNELTAHIATYSRTAGHGYNEDDVLEITQQTMVKIWKGLDSLSDSKTFFKWMNVTADRTCLDFWNKASNKHEVSATDFTTVIDEDDEDFEKDSIFNQFDVNEELTSLNMAELTDIVSTCMTTLDDSTQELIQMKFFDGLSYTEMANQTGIAEGTIRQKISRGKAKLGEAMEVEAKKRDFKLYNFSFFAIFLFLHSKLSGCTEEETTALLAGGHFDKLLSTITDTGAKATATKAAEGAIKYVPFFSTKIGKAIVAGCVAVGLIGGTAIGFANAKKSETNAEEAPVETAKATEDPIETEQTVENVTARYDADDFTVETNGKEVNSDSNPLNYIVIKDSDGNEISLARESKKKYTYDCDKYSVEATYDNRKLSEDNKSLSATVILTVIDKTVDAKPTGIKCDVNFTVKQQSTSTSASAPSTVSPASSDKTNDNVQSIQSQIIDQDMSSAQTKAHVHTWATTTTTVVDQEAYDEIVVDQEAYDEQVQSGGGYYKCNACGASGWTECNASESENNILMHIVTAHSGEAGYTYVPITYTSVHHDAVTHVVHHDAITHPVTTTVCSTCGATK